MTKFKMDSIRQYRIQLYPDAPGFFINNSGIGIAMFDLIGTFLVLYAFDYILNLKLSFKYYLLLIPIAAIIHWYIGQTTFLNTMLFDFNNQGIYYKLLMVLLLYVVFFTNK